MVFIKARYEPMVSENSPLGKQISLRMVFRAFRSQFLVGGGGKGRAARL